MMKVNFTRIVVFLMVSVFALSILAQDNNEEWRSKMPVRRLHKTPAVIVVDSTDNTTYYFEPKDDKKVQKQEKKRQKEEQEKQKRIAKYLQKRAEQNPGLEEELEARKARQVAEMAELDSLLAIEYTIEEFQYGGPQPLVWVNEPINESVGELSNSLLVTADRVMPKKVSMDVTNNDMFFYFDVVNGLPQPLRFHAQYYADDPLMIEKARFVVNGFNYYFTPAELPNTGKDGPRMYWETIDEKLSSADKDMVYALSHATWARVVFIGAEGFSHVKKFTASQIQDFYAVVALYLKMGGKL